MMARNRRFLCLVLALCLVLTAPALGGCQKKQDDFQTEQTDPQSKPAAVSDANYAAALFDTGRVHTVDVALSDSDWSDLQANPTNKTKYQADITIDGETVKAVSFSTKGNTSLSMVASAGSDRYSFKVNFGKYVDGQTYHGLNTSRIF